jgi:hypothetical protein
MKLASKYRQQQQPPEEPIESWTGVRWEYKLLESGFDSAKLEELLNQLGLQGWEVVGLAGPRKDQMGAMPPPMLVAVLKRPAP